MKGTNSSKKSFGELLWERRTALNISQENLAEMLFPDANSLESNRKKVGKWENNRSEPTASEFRRLCEVLKCDPEYLWGMIDEPRRATRTVMEVTQLDQRAVEMLVEFTDQRVPGYVDPGYIIGCFLKDPDFYRVIGEIRQNVWYTTLLERNRIREQFVIDDRKNEYVSGMEELRSRIESMKLLTEEVGYSVVSVDELIRVFSFRINQSMGKVLTKTIELLCNEASEDMHQLLKVVMEK